MNPIVTLICTTFLAAAAPEEPVAMVLKVKGSVLHQAGAARPARLRSMEMVRASDRLTTSADADAVLYFFEDRHLEQLSPKFQFTVSAKGCSPALAVRRLKSPAGARPEDAKGLKKLAPSGRGGIVVPRGFEIRQGDQPALPQSPIQGAKVLTPTPTLVWSPAEGVVEYRVRLSEGDRVLWQLDTVRTRLPYPQAQAPLQWGRTYVWTVSSTEANPRRIAEGSFTLADEAEAKDLAARQATAGTDETELLLLLAAYEAHGAYDDALALCERLARLAPDEPSYQAVLASYYDQAGRKAEAEAARRRAVRQAE